MGWYATAQALKEGTGAYGTVAESLRGESDPPRTLSVALAQVFTEVASGEFLPERNGQQRLVYWARRNCHPIPAEVKEKLKGA
jgi:hypothetical protein